MEIFVRLVDVCEYKSLEVEEDDTLGALTARAIQLLGVRFTLATAELRLNDGNELLGKAEDLVKDLSLEDQDRVVLCEGEVGWKIPHDKRCANDECRTIPCVSIKGQVITDWDFCSDFDDELYEVTEDQVRCCEDVINRPNVYRGCFDSVFVGVSPCGLHVYTINPLGVSKRLASTGEILMTLAVGDRSLCRRSRMNWKMKSAALSPCGHWVMACLSYTDYRGYALGAVIQWNTTTGKVESTIHYNRSDRADHFKFHNNRVAWLYCRGSHKMVSRVASFDIQTQTHTVHSEKDVNFCFTPSGGIVTTPGRVMRVVKLPKADEWLLPVMKKKGIPAAVLGNKVLFFKDGEVSLYTGAESVESFKCEGVSVDEERIALSPCGEYIALALTLTNTDQDGRTKEEQDGVLLYTCSGSKFAEIKSKSPITSVMFSSCSWFLYVSSSEGLRKVPLNLPTPSSTRKRKAADMSEEVQPKKKAAKKSSRKTATKAAAKATAKTTQEEAIDDTSSTSSTSSTSNTSQDPPEGALACKYCGVWVGKGGGVFDTEKKRKLHESRCERKKK